jgi:fatty-acyl-CoA synthase
MHSYARGREAELLECTIHDRFLETVRANPDGEALVVVDQGVRLTWAELAEEVERTARGLAGLGFGPGSRVGIWATNCAEWILLQLAAPRAGVTLVNINPAYRAHELEYVLRKSRIEAIFLRESDERSCYREILERAMGGRALPLKHTIYIGEGRGTGSSAMGAASRQSKRRPRTSRTFSTPPAQRDLPKESC